jgi:chromosomal replication initiation ATPase DnaA
MNKAPALHNVGTGDLVAELNNRGYSPEDAKAEQIISFVARRFDIDRALLLTRHTNARQVSAYLIRKCTNLTWAEISYILGFGDHTGAVHASKQGELIYNKNTDLEIWQDYEEVKKP